MGAGKLPAYLYAKHRNGRFHCYRAGNSSYWIKHLCKSTGKTEKENGISRNSNTPQKCRSFDTSIFDGVSLFLGFRIPFSLSMFNSGVTGTFFLSHTPKHLNFPGKYEFGGTGSVILPPIPRNLEKAGY